MPTSKFNQIRNNSIIVFFFQFLSLLFNILSISLAARYLGVEEFGKFNYLLAIVGISAKILDFGFNPIIFRELSRDNNFDKYFSSALIFRIFIILFIILLFGVLSYLIELSTLKIVLLIILSFNVLFSNKFTNIRELLTIPFKIDLIMYIPMSLVILDNILLLGFILLMPIFEGGILYFTLAYTVSNIPGIILLYKYLRKRFNFQFKFKTDEISYLFKESLPLIGFIVIAFIYTQIDILFLEHLSGSRSVGVYSSALRLIMPLKLIPNAIVISLFAFIVKNVNDNKKNQLVFSFVSKLFFIFSISFSALMFVGSEDIILFLFGEKYLEAVLPLKILALSVFFDFFSFFVLDFFTAYKKQNYNFKFILLITSILILSNYYLIPIYNYTGSSLSRLISGIFGFLFLVVILKKEIKINIDFLNLQLIASALILSLSIYLLDGIHFIINIIVSNIILICYIIFFKVFTKDEMKIILQLGNNQKLLSFFYDYYGIEKNNVNKF